MAPTPHNRRRGPPSRCRSTTPPPNADSHKRENGCFGRKTHYPFHAHKRKYAGVSSPHLHSSRQVERMFAASACSCRLPPGCKTSTTRGSEKPNRVDVRHIASVMSFPPPYRRAKACIVHNCCYCFKPNKISARAYMHPVNVSDRGSGQRTQTPPCPSQTIQPRRPLMGRSPKRGATIETATQ